MNTRAFLTACVLSALVQTAPGVIVINANETENLAAPKDGSPWDYVGRLENSLTAPASAIYLGNRYVLTASHVIEDSHAFFLNGVRYKRDTSFTQVTIQNTDMRIMRIIGDPGLPPLPLIDPADSEFNQPCVMVGYGVGKSTPVPSQGWNWGDDTTRLKRWATNKTLGMYRVFPPMNLIITSFDRSAGNREGQLTSGDSGGALFIKYKGIWKLAGLNVDVDTQGQALYDNDRGKAGNQPDRSYFVSVKQVLPQLRTFVPAGPPTGATKSVKEIVTDLYDSTESVPGSMAVLDNTLYFFDDDPEYGCELWKSDSTAEGTMLVKDLNPGTAHGNPQWLTPMGGALYFVATDETNGTELWKTDGTTEGTTLVKDIFPGTSGSNPTSLTVMGQTLFFSANDGLGGAELWMSDGTEAGTVQVKDINPGSGGSSPLSLAAVGNSLYFQAYHPSVGVELWKSDGTAVGTILMKDIAPSRSDSSPVYLTALGNMVFFSAFTMAAGSELWASNGTLTSTGTARLKDIVSGAGSGDPRRLIALGSTLYFTAADAAYGRELWKSNGKSGGTVRVKDIIGGKVGSEPRFLTASAGTLYFSARTVAHGIELWKSNGAAAGTLLVKDLIPGAASSDPQWLTTMGGRLYFQARTPASGAELWTSDGTAAGTMQRGDLTGDAADSEPRYLCAARGKLFFIANSTPPTGRKLFVFDPAENNVAAP